MHTTSKVSITSGLIAVSLVCGSALLQPSSVTAQTNSVETAEYASSTALSTSYDVSSSIQQMRARLADPVQRTVVRAEERQKLEASHAGLAETLGIDAAEEHALLELLTEQRLEQLDDFYGGGTQRGFSDLPAEARMADLARQKVRQRQALADLLGEQDLERYLDLAASLTERAQVSELNDRLDAAH
ncbi:MAG TPA: hypothetical protein VKB34_10360, partial [Povalibacter sp.]|nr:hypothetical protein [Povalibacter sp.]